MASSGQQGSAPRRPAVGRVASMDLDGASDRQRGPGSSQGSVSGAQAGGSQRGSAPTSPARSRAGSASTSDAGPGPFHKGSGVDPAFDPNDPRSSRVQMSDTELIGKRVDLPAEAFSSSTVAHPFVKRPAFNTSSKPISVQLNLFSVTNLPAGDIYQYDVVVSPNPKDSKALVKKVWNSQAVQQWVKSTGSKWLYDGHKLAWSTKTLSRGEHRITVDLDKEAGKPPGGNNTVYYFQIKATTTIRMQMLTAYLQQKAQWDTHVLECMNFLDHVMRQWPSERMELIKRNFYPRDGQEFRLDDMIVVRKGTYSAFRLGQSELGSPSVGLSLNVDVANTAFWLGGQTFAKLAQYVCAPPATRRLDSTMPMGKLADLLRPKKVQDKLGNTRFIQSDDFKKLRRLLRLSFHVTHVGKEHNPRVYKVARIIFDEKYGKNGADSFAVTFVKKDKKTGKEEKPISIYDHWLNKYGRLGYPDLPMVETSRNGIFPMEVCKLVPFQRYAYKLDPDQTAQMIKIAVSRPKSRRDDIMNGVEHLQWDKDPYFREYGVRVQKSMVISKARLIQNPDVLFGGGVKIDPKVSGRWDLRGKKFIEPNPTPLVSWGFIGCGMNDGHAVEKDALKAFAQTFVRIYKGHGGRIQKDPYVQVYPYNVPYNEMCDRGFRETGMNAKAQPQILFFVVSTRNSLVYERLKKNMDCRVTLVSQVLLADHVRKNNAQYCSNVAMKVNAKLGGATCQSVPAGAKAGFSFFAAPTMILGMDVSHASPGSNMPSKAAMTMSIDKTATKYCSTVQTNGYRVEVVQPQTMHFLFSRMMNHWKAKIGCSPQHVYYFRDGVAEGQFNHVIDIEINELKRMFREAKFEVPRFTVIVATKRHHIRFFPKPGDQSAGDRNDNPLPGTLVERDATHPFHFDFYLSSHVAIQGTARPVHYSVILDEANIPVDKLQQMIYHQCYQYIRSTTPVSLHPAVYYSHLASLRAQAHEDIAAELKEVPTGKAGFPLRRPESAYSGGKPPTEAPRLTPMGLPGGNLEMIKAINTTMWFI
ncbi:hypothetical protein PFICI_03839 [Pestalotiopsis fici W106-1]|uniref:Uncharacterized protein n=1 Tax=Pestalotiopsis fici (strain W106-1 / CGMCC3.15140) TaxID=1229662 RepID=W3XII9_PESFW|nr:uncharacterized protein PFICI_03839 [Pestalotiopsis fici W106-1]ETS85814.1 hypothetical protein PFICI_03839 [Pestalotiopsis fici W106-1]